MLQERPTEEALEGGAARSPVQPQDDRVYSRIVFALDEQIVQALIRPANVEKPRVEFAREVRIERRKVFDQVSRRSRQDPHQQYEHAQGKQGQ